MAKMISEPALQLLKGLFTDSVNKALPSECLSEHWPDQGAVPPIILAIGKAAIAMAEAAVQHYGEGIQGLVLVPENYRQHHQLPDSFQVICSPHPYPDHRSVEAADAALDMVANLGRKDLLLVLLSGGGSSVMCKPRRGISLAQKLAVTRQLQDAGASISELNCVRKQLSAVKGGKLAQATRARVISLAISDIPGNDPSLISSGPTVNDQSTPDQALEILSRYQVTTEDSVLTLLNQPTKKFRAFVKEADARFRIVASGNTMLEHAAQYLEAKGFQVVNLGDQLEGDARTMAGVQAHMVAWLAHKGGKHCILSGGESTVVLKENVGSGGRNTEFLLTLARALDGLEGVWSLACDSDGIDGNGNHAGALIGPDTLSRAKELGIDPDDFLQRNDSATFFQSLDDLVVTGPIMTNVNDFRVILIDRD